MAEALVVSCIRATFYLSLEEKDGGWDMATKYENVANFASCSAYKCRLFDVKQFCGAWIEARHCLDGRTRTRHHG